MTDFLAWLDPLAIAVVIGGSLLAASLRATRGEAGAAFAALRLLVRADPDADEAAARAAIHRVEAIVETKNIVCVDRAETTGRFLAEAVRRLSDARSSADYARWTEETLAARARRHGGAIAFWRSAADAAPAMGMIATVVGLIRMFRTMDDPTHLGAPMASALVATLLGLVVANLIAGPIAERLERLSAAELGWQRRALDHLLRLAQAELDHAVGLQRQLARSIAR